MTHQQKLEKYVDYASSCATSGNVPMPFDKWCEFQAKLDATRRIFPVRLLSETIKDGEGKPSWLTYNIEAENEALAVQIARERLTRYEMKYTQETDSLGRPLTTEQIRQNLIEKLQKMQQREIERQELERQRLIKQLQKAAATLS